MFENYLVHELHGAAIQLRDGGGADANAFPGLTDPGLWTVAVLQVESGRSVHSHVWERHPAGSEVLGALSGAIEVYLRDHGEGSAPVVTLTAGQAFIVPPGRWHRLGVHEPGDLLVITPRSGTEHAHVADGGTAELIPRPSERLQP
jgi:oxalate decarboxylase/phosphoglucose isomerase-like protein (cupin superfamily)